MSTVAPSVEYIWTTVQIPGKKKKPAATILLYSAVSTGLLAGTVEPDQNIPGLLHTGLILLGIGKLSASIVGDPALAKAYVEAEIKKLSTPKVAAATAWDEMADANTKRFN